MLPLLRQISALLGRWQVALIAVLSIAAVVLLPGLGDSGLWEPHERQVADRVAPPLEKEAEDAGRVAPVAAPAPEDTCVRTPPKDAAARSLSNRAPKWGRDHFGDDDQGRRLPFALMGLLTVLATAGIAIRFAGARAGIIAGLIALSMPLLTFQSRMLTSEIGTACGATLIVYALVAMSRLGAAYGTALAAIDAMISIAALTLGSMLGFYGGGALLGLVVPIGAFAAAGGLGVPAVRAALKRERILPHVPPLIAALVASGLVGLLAYQLYELKAPVPGMMPPAREVLGKAIVPEGCWSWALGGLWRPDDDLRMIYDSTFEQIAYGTFPWGVLAPIAMAMLLRSDDHDQRGAGAITLAWAGGAWIAGEAFQRKVGFTLYAGFPALAIAVGVWFDALLARRAKEGADAAPKRDHTLILIGLFGFLAVLVLAKDMQSFTERVTSLTIGSDAIPYPTQSRLLLLPTRVWVLVLGVIVGLGIAITLMVWRAGASSEGPSRGRARRRFAAFAPAVTIAATVVLGAFWSLVWMPRLAIHLSSKAMFDTYRELRKPGDQLVIMGDLGQAARAYAEAKPELVTSRDQIVSALGRPGRVFAVAPQTELCTLHREVGGKPYYVLDDRNTRSLLLSNKVDGAVDKNPLATAIVHVEPANLSQRPKGKVVFDGRIQLLGWDIPQTMSRGAKVQLKVYYKILMPVGGAWKTLMHFDGPLRFNGDHEPINGRCPTSTWQPGDYIIDTYTISAGGSAFPTGKYDLWIGFFTGSAPNWKNMVVSEAPGDMRDTADRVKIMSVTLD